MICLDSDFIIDFLRGEEKAIEKIKVYKDEVTTTEVTKFEVFFGIYIKKKIDEHEEKSAQLFFDSIEILPFDDGCGREAASILTTLSKEGKTIEQNDCFIAAIMRRHGCTKIITGNIDHFKRIKGLE